METDSLNDRIKAFVAKQTAARVNKLNLNTRLMHDLGVEGHDGTDLMLDFSKQFHVDITRYRADLHFGPEAGCNPIFALLLIFYRPRWCRFIPITIGDLVEAAQTGHWQTPNREPA